MDEQGKRNKNFSKQELEVMVEEIAARKRLLLERLDNCGVTAETKQKACAGLAESFSVVGGMAKDSDAVKKKWSDIKSAAKKKGSERPLMWTSWRRRCRP